MTLYISSVQTKIGFIVHDDRLSVGGRGSDMWGNISYIHSNYINRMCEGHYLLNGIYFYHVAPL